MIMNDTLKTIFSRKSVRVYQDKPISKEDLELLVKAGMAAPSGADTRSWAFVIIQDRKTLDSLAERLKYGKMLRKAPAAIAVCAKPKESLFEGDEYWMFDCSVASENILLAAESIGLGGVWVSLYPNQERIRHSKEILQLPPDVEGLSIISLGYPLRGHKAKDKFDKGKIHWNQW